MKIQNTLIHDVKLIQPKIFGDPRGYFFELFRENAYREELNISQPFVQDNCSLSQKNVLRGLHYQTVQTQGKLVSVLAGRIFDVAVDIRPNSPTYKKWVGVELSAENHHQLWVPAGLAHGFLTLEDNTQVLYKCTDYYHPESEKTLMWDDPSIAVDWPLDGQPIVSKKDSEGYYL